MGGAPGLDVRAAAHGPVRAGTDRPGLRRARHRRRDLPGRAAAGHGAEHAPLVPVRRDGAVRAAVRAVRLRVRRGRGGAGAAGRAARGLRRALPVPAQDGLLVRLGLGADPGDGRDLAAGAAGALVDGPDRPGASAGHRRGGRGRRRTGRRRRTDPGRGAAHRGGDGGRRPGPCRGGRRARRGTAPGPGTGVVVATRLRRTAAVRRGVAAAARRGHAGRVAAADRLPDRGTGPAAGRARQRLHPGRQRRAAVRAGRQLDPRRRLPLPDHPGALPGAAGAGGRGGCGPGAGLGRRDLRERGLLRRLRRTRAAGLAGLPVRLRGLPGGAAAAR